MYRKALLTCALAVLSAVRAGAQDVSGTLVDGEGAPVGAAVVVLVDSAGGRTSPVLTDAAGGFRLRAARPGRYRVRAERVGFATTFSAPLLLTAAQPASVRLVASSTPITLEGITVRAGNRCRIGDGSERGTAVLWEEARKALTAAEQAEAARALHYEFVSYHRELEPGSLAIRSEEAETRRANVRSPFGSTSLDTLLDMGFVRAVGDSVSWDAPDAQVLLSQRFLNTHCFQVVEHRDSSRLIGLGFRPVRGRRLPDVTGTLWLDRGSALLRFLEYRYVNAGAPGRHPRVGGRVEFERLPSGHWIVRRWYIRIPQAGPDEVLPTVQNAPLSTFRNRPVVRGLVEFGGEVTEASDQPLAVAAAPAHLAGVVWDSVRGRPLAGATVAALGTAWTALTDSAGSFRLGPLPPGRYTISFADPMLTVVGMPAPVAEVSVPEDSARMIALSIPGAAAIAARHCPTLARDRGILLGRAVSDGAAADEAEVTVAWSGMGQDRRSVEQQRLRTRTGADGTFLICDVPTELTLQVRVSWQGRAQRTTLNPRGVPVYVHLVEL